ncbi:thiamine phosphate synthase [Acuticoccus mangrovi]|uniref:Thiamine-phosphate synthase n=1 Tax=Acuticoccus mangrovi TaxID=2796142 RepID=A0A934ITY8_9HYPH|nr:thiamine phosphate synthase [Acuticoccus mangrovi]MBJ3777990.1 thiamine phosphate synthase [Acuticoccus mangrovi]
MDALTLPSRLDRPALAEAIDALLSRRPRIHALMSPVAQPLSANIGAALGIDISMTIDAEEVRPMAAGSDALLVNLGMLEPARRAGILAAVATGRPFVLDPVKVDRVPDRLAFARELLALGPRVVKGNAGEMAALGPLPEGTVAVTTGAVDTVRRCGGGPALRLANGTPLLDRVIATGCATGMLIAAMLPGSRDAFTAAVAGLGLMTVSAEAAAVRAAGPGSFAAGLIDALAAADGTAVAAGLRLAPGPLDLRCYLVLGPDVADPVGLVRRAVAGGVSLIQWRDKAGSTADQVAAVRRLVAATDVPVLVNDRVDVALAAGAAGVHVGHGDLTSAEARRLVGEAAIVGLTVHSLAEADAAEGAPIDYASVGGVYETISKKNPNPPIGVEGFRAITERLRRHRPMPVCAIAGITAARARELVAAGADGVAVMSAITRADDPAAAAAVIRDAVGEGRS